MKFNTYLTEEKEYPLAEIQQKADTLKAAGQDIINLTVGDPKEETFEPLKEIIIKEISELRHSQYPKAAGDPDYLDAVSIWAKEEYNATIDSTSEILSCNGSKEAIFTIPIAFDWSNGKKIFIPSLSYPVYEMSAGLMGIEVEHLPLSKENQFLPDLGSIPDEKWAECGIFWLNSPHNPTTTIASKSYIEELLSIAKKHDFLVCSDECYNALYFNERPASCLDFTDSQHWLVFRSLSKRSHMTGFRIGAMISKNKALIKTLKKMRNSMGVGTPTFIQKAAIGAWKDAEHAQKNALKHKRKRDLIYPLLKAKGFDIFGAEAGFYFWFSHPKLATSEAICDYLLEAGLVVTPGTAFGDDGQGYARMVYCETDPIMEDVAQRIRNLREL